MDMQILKQLWRFIVRMDVVSILIVLLLGLAAIGTCFPQLPASSETDSTSISLWQEQARLRYGAFSDFLTSIGVFHFYRSRLFILSLVILAISTLICTLDRWKSVWRRTFHHEIGCSDATFQTAPYSAIVTGKKDKDLSRILQKHLVEHGFRIHTKTDDDSLHLRGDRYRIALLSSLVSHLGVILLLLGILLSTAFSWREEIILEPNEISDFPHRPGITVRPAGFFIERYPDNSAADYEARIVITNEVGQIVHANVRPNKPLKYQGVQLILTGYIGLQDDYRIIFQAVHDPGFGATTIAGFLLLLAVTISFNFPHSCIHARREPDGRLLIAGRAERRAYSFEREFSNIVEDLKTM
jgi:cytochrome c biogenesis protein ResB